MHSKTMDVMLKLAATILMTVCLVASSKASVSSSEEANDDPEGNRQALWLGACILGALGGIVLLAKHTSAKPQDIKPASEKDEDGLR